MRYPPALVTLIRELGRLPGIGPKSAQRLAFYLFNRPDEEVLALAQALTEAKHTLGQCPVCFNITVAGSPRCEVCADPSRDRGLICAVEQPADLMAIERSGEYDGLYHVLHGALSPMNGVGPDQLTLGALLGRLAEPERVAALPDGEAPAVPDDAPAPDEPVREVILATSTTVEGEATAMYLARLLGDLGVSVSRIAYGLPVGGDLEYADEVTLGRAITNRRPV